MEISGHENRTGGMTGYRGLHPEFALDEKIQITDRNLCRLDEEEQALYDKQEAFLAEKCRAFLSEVSAYSAEELYIRLLQDDDLSTQFRLFSERMLYSESTDSAITENTAFYKSRIRNEQIRLCRMLAKTQKELPTDLIKAQNVREDEGFQEEEHTRRIAADKIAYLKNGYTEKAFRAFSEYLGRANPVYYSDFPGVCEALYYGHTTGCILPLENSADGKLSRFYTLLDKYDLRIEAVAAVSSDDGDTVTKYALLRKSVVLPSDVARENLYMECRLILDDGLTLSDILNAAEAYGLTLTRVDTRMLAYLTEEHSYDLILSVGNGDLAAMLLFCCLMIPQFTLLGIYREVLL